MSFELSTVEPVKENFAPVKTGRVFTATGGLSARAGPAAADWEKRIASSADPLAVWKEYISHTEAAHPSGGPLLLQLLERATRALVSEERYRNDPRYIELWVAYADLLPEPGDVFKYLHANRIGEDCALFFMAWAWCAEHKGNFAFADKVYARGQARKAAPLDRLAARYRQFQRRMYKKWVAAQGGEGAPAAEARVDLEALTAAMRDAVAGPGGKVVLPEVVRAAGSQQQQQQPALPRDENGAPRAALGRITAHAAARSHRPTAFAEDGAYREDGGFEEALGGDGMGGATAAAAAGQRAATLGLFAPSTRATPAAGLALNTASAGTYHAPAATAAQQRPPPLPAAAAGPTRQPAAPPLVIFEDEGIAPPPASRPSGPASQYRVDELGVQYSSASAAAATAATAAAAAAGSSKAAPLAARRVELGTEAVRRKENDEAPAAWSALGPLPVHAGTRAIAPAARVADSRIPIYVDDNRKEEFNQPLPLPLPKAVASSRPATTTTTFTTTTTTAASIPAPTASKSAEEPADDAPSVEEVRAAAWLLAHPAIASEIAACRDKLAQGVRGVCSVYDREEAQHPAQGAAAEGARGGATPVAAALHTSARAAAAAAPSPAFPASFSPGLQSGNVGRTVRESMLNRLFEDVDEQQEEQQQQQQQQPAALHLPKVATTTPSLAASGRGGGFHLSGFGGGEDVSSIQGDGMSHGNIAVTVHTQMDFRGMLGAAAASKPSHAASSAIPIFSDFDDAQQQPPMQPRFLPASSAFRPALHASPPPPPPQQQQQQHSAGGAAEDVTINTRRAMNDLDGMFASPSSKGGFGGAGSGGRGRQAKASAPPVPFASMDAAPALAVAATAPTRGAAAPPPPPPISENSSSSSAGGSLNPVPAVKTRAIAPDAKRLSMGFSLNRRQSGMGLPSGRASISHAHLPAPRGLPSTTTSTASAPAAAAAAASRAAAAAAAAASAHVQSPLPPSPILASSLSSFAPSMPFQLGGDGQQGAAAGEREREEEEAEEEDLDGRENAGPRAQHASSSTRPVLGSSVGYEASSSSGGAFFGTSRVFGGCADTASIKHPLNPINSFTVAVDPEFVGNGGQPNTAKAYF